MGIYCLGDCHGTVLPNLSFKKNPEVRQISSEDVLILLGDVGLMWPGYEKQGAYELNWLNNQKYTTLMIRGNHDNVNWWESCPPTKGNSRTLKLAGGDLRQAKVGDTIYNNIFMVTSSALLDICGQSALCIGGAESTDAWNVVYPHEKFRIAKLKKERQWFRVINKTWWPGEKIDIDYLCSLLRGFGWVQSKQALKWQAEQMPQRQAYCGAQPLDCFDFIFSHQSPASFVTSSGLCSRRDRRIALEEQKCLEDINQVFKFKHWYHGHQHVIGTYNLGTVTCLYNYVTKINLETGAVEDWPDYSDVPTNVDDNIAKYINNTLLS